jgi:hypothetical protein
MPAVMTEYWYIPDFHTLVKKSIGGSGFRFVAFDSPTLVV